MSNAPFSWRRFQFFEKDMLTEESKEPMLLFRELNVTCSTSGRGNLIFGDKSGTIYTVNRSFEYTSFRPYGGKVIALQQLKRSDILASLGMESGEDEYNPASNPLFKIWKLDAENKEPVCLRTIPLFSSSKFPEVPVTCFSLLEDQSQLAVGLGNGALMLFELYRTTIRQQLLLPEGPCVTGVHFRENGANVSLFVVTSEEVMTFFTKPENTQSRLLSSRGSGVTKVVIDSGGGCEIGCSILTEEKQLVVAQDQAVFFYEPEEKGICFGFEGKKHLVGWFNHYLYLVYEGNKDERVHLTIYDIKNKFIAYSSTFDPVINIVSEWNSIFVLTSKKKVYQLSEKDRQTKMEMLFRKNLYTIALSLANTQDLDRSYVTDIHQMYGDHLYSKGDYEGAIEQYLETINFIEPSYVIRKFLDSQRINNLTRYLQVLHEKECATIEHTTLLLNCYTKLKDDEKLDQFIKSSNLKFDVETAINVCRQAAYPEHALFLARKHQQHKLYLKIQAEKEDEGKEKYQSILRYIWSLRFPDAQKYIKEYGARLVKFLTNETTEMLLALCVNYEPRPLPCVPGDPPELEPRDTRRFGRKSDSKCNPEDFIHFFLGQPDKLQIFLDEVTQKIKCSTAVFNTLLELYLRQGIRPDQDSESKSNKALSHPSRHKIMAVLKSDPVKYDINHALVLVKMYKFEKGVLFLYKKLDLYHEILQHHMDRNNYSAIIQACKIHGDNKEGDSNLWVIALTYFADKKATCDEQIIQILDHIERHGLLPPLRVVQILSRNRRKPLAVVKDYIIRTLQQENSEISSDQQEIRRYQHDTQQMRKKIEQLKSRSITFQGTKCHACTSILSLPAVHFLCMHSFHQRCVVDSDRECPKCTPEFHKVKEMRAKLNDGAKQHDAFFKEIYNAPDGFACAAEYFGRGIFDRTALSDPLQK